MKKWEYLGVKCVFMIPLIQNVTPLHYPLSNGRFYYQHTNHLVYYVQTSGKLLNLSNYHSSRDGEDPARLSQLSDQVFLLSSPSPVSCILGRMYRELSLWSSSPTLLADGFQLNYSGRGGEMRERNTSLSLDTSKYKFVFVPPSINNLYSLMHCTVYYYSFKDLTNHLCNSAMMERQLWQI